MESRNHGNELGLVVSHGSSARLRDGRSGAPYGEEQNSDIRMTVEPDYPDKCYLFMPEARTIVEYESDEDRDTDIRAFNGRNIPHQKMKTMDEVPEEGSTPCSPCPMSTIPLPW